MSDAAILQTALIILGLPILSYAIVFFSIIVQGLIIGN